MPWVAQDDHYFHNPKARAIGPLGRELFSASWCYCSIQLNDGLFVSEDVPVIAALAQVEPSIADLLFTQELWHPEGTDCAKCRAVGQAMPVPAGRVAVHEYLKQNKTREKVLAEREDAAERQRQHRSRKKSQRDSQETDSVTSAVPIPSPPHSDTSSRRPRNSRATGDTPADDEISTVPEAVWTEYAQLKLNNQRNGSVENPGPWKRATAKNARTDLGQTASRWWREFDVTPGQLAAALLNDQAPAAHYRRKAPA